MSSEKWQSIVKDKYKFLVLICLFDLVFLLICAKFLSISYYEAAIYFNKNDAIGYVVRASTTLFGQNDFALRLPIVILHFISIFLIYKLSKFYLKNSTDRLASVAVFILLPGTLASALIVNNAALCVCVVLLLLYLFHLNLKLAFYIVLALSFFLNGDFLVVYAAFFIYGVSKKDPHLIWSSALLFLATFYIFGFDTGGHPSGHFADTFGIFAAVFSPFVFFYFIYTIYRIWVKESKSPLWFVCVGAFCFCMVLSLRQKLELEEFLPFCVIATPLMIKMFFSNYRVRLPKFRGRYNILAGFLLISLLLNYLAIVLNPIFYNFLDEPKDHFAYKFQGTKELAKALKNTGYLLVDADDKEALRLKFYGILDGDKKLVLDESGDIVVEIFGKKVASYSLK
ncbi:glycosyltransferase family 39 protein [Campylobacter sp. 9BO]|uniref:glycosyltransferase family 39 protein n=1 Tax=Campylobacter sp. 9BO TaxID=3424759 RepID=UPI003D34169A